MKATLEFNLPEETEDFNTYRSAPDLHYVIVEWLAQQRQKLKYESDKFTSEQLNMIEKLRAEMFAILRDNNLSDIL
jgi:hypothetical protein